MVEFRGLPFFLVMASRTFIAQRALVHIILAMARNTRSRRLLLGKERCLVAAYALCLLMLAQQLEFRSRIMIEIDLLPILFHMACFAFLAILPLMLVGFQVAGHTFMRRSFVFGRVDMTFAAFHICVLAIERKTSLFERVVEFRFFPAALVMATLAIGAQTALVLINLAMAVIAC